MKGGAEDIRADLEAQLAALQGPEEAALIDFGFKCRRTRASMA